MFYKRDRRYGKEIRRGLLDESRVVFTVNESLPKVLRGSIYYKG